jgi:hypothetical protein
MTEQKPFTVIIASEGQILAEHVIAANASDAMTAAKKQAVENAYSEEDIDGEENLQALMNEWEAVYVFAGELKDEKVN